MILLVGFLCELSLSPVLVQICPVLQLFQLTSFGVLGFLGGTSDGPSLLGAFGASAQILREASALILS